jgi:hypothetical protein
MQQKTHGTAEQTAQADGKNAKKEATGLSTAEQQPNT